MEKPEVILKIERAIEKDRGVALSYDELLELATYINQNAAIARGHSDMLHAFIDRSPALASRYIH